jgi:phage recombination protein Bet
MNDSTLAVRKEPSSALTEAEVLRVLQNSLYPGAQPESIGLVVGYCKASSLDIMLKPVHIVPMSIKTGRKDSNGDDVYEQRDIVMPGIGLYRTTAARTGRYGGKTEPEFGPMRTLEYTDNRKNKRTLEYPEWCKVTIYRIVDGEPRAYTAKEYWLENYATASRYSEAPNAMWNRRPFGQLAKCAEAQALRMAFPEVGASPTAEEIEGHHTIDDAPAFPPPEPRRASDKPPTNDEVVDAQLVTPPPGTPAVDAQAVAEAPPTNSKPIEGGKLAYLRQRMLGMSEGRVSDLLQQVGATRLDHVTDEQFVKLRSLLV